MKELRFSQRIGKTEIRTALQIDSMDRVLRNRLWNLCDDIFARANSHAYMWFKNTLFFYWTDFEYNIASDSTSKIYTNLADNFINNYGWFDVYDFLEFFTERLYDLSFMRDTQNNQTYVNFIENVNLILEEEKSAYRFINGLLSPIISEVEIASIETAINDSGWSSVSTHLEKALIFFSDRKNPDYSNSIKEAISAVEAACQIITGKTNITLGQALKEVEANHNIETALKTSFSILYGYTSDKDGIRHALMEGESGASFENAQFMLVACSAFVNYLKVKTKK